MKITIKSRYGVAPDKLLNDPNISLKAKGLFAYLQSKPDNWRFSVARITSQTKDGKDSVKSAIRELEKAGYLKRKPRKGDAGKWDGYDYILTENPLEMIDELAVFPLTDFPSTEKPSTGKRATISKTDYSKTDYSKIDIINKKMEKLKKTFGKISDEYLKEAGIVSLRKIIRT